MDSEHPELVRRAKAEDTEFPVGTHGTGGPPGPEGIPCLEMTTLRAVSSPCTPGQTHRGMNTSQAAMSIPSLSSSFLNQGESDCSETYLLALYRWGHQPKPKPVLACITLWRIKHLYKQCSHCSPPPTPTPKHHPCFQNFHHYSTMVLCSGCPLRIGH